MSDGYASTGPLASRIAIHEHGTNPVPWFAFVRSLLPPAGLLLDAGAGTGALWAEATDARVVAADLSVAMCAALAGRGLPVARAAADRLPFANGVFDGAVCNHVLYHLDNPRDGVAELRRVVRPGGWVAVATNGAGHMAELADVAVMPPAVHLRFPAESVAEAMGQFFAEVAVHRYDDVLDVRDPEPVVAYAASVGAPVSAEAVAEVIARDGTFRIGKHTVLAIAR